ncbi:MAG: U32 family peptidase, partial [Syntrophomonadaceae bacterium]|nr:U32 family peptidase [Syntrophomonadaceae bacterium]
MELLAPAGNWEAFLAAIHNGADAVYLGGQQFSARQSADNFTAQQMNDALDYAHMRGKKIYVTVNTLIADAEFPEALNYLFRLQQMGVDAVILQDVGLLKAARTILPALRIHASTQMTIHNPEGAAWLQGQGVKRIVLARELSAEEIKLITISFPRLELEVFVHGALCFCYSGQCLFSSMVGGRSGNRGRCAQPCRLPYEIHCRSGKESSILAGQGRYLLSPADLCLIEYLPALAECGVTSLKIEGRMKRPEYVAVVTRAYREALDELAASGDYHPEKAILERLLGIFNRNFTSGYFIESKAGFLSSRRPNNRGTYVGRVLEQKGDLNTRIRLSAPISLGDGLTVWMGQGTAPAAVVKEILVDNERVLEAKTGQTIEIKLDGRVMHNDRVFKTHDQKLLTEAQASIRDDARWKIPVDAEVYLEAGQKMRLVIADRREHRVEVHSRNAAQPSQQHPLDHEVLRQKIARLGNTPFVLDKLDVYGDNGLLVPFSDINEARRRATDLLADMILQPWRPEPQSENGFRQEKELFLQQKPLFAESLRPGLTVLVNRPEQARLAMEAGADMVYVDLAGLGQEKWPLMRGLQAMESERSDRIVPLLPRIHQSGDKFAYKQAVLSGFDSVMIASWSDLEWALANVSRVYADYGLNIYNRHTLDILVGKGLKTACLSPELNFVQLEAFREYPGIELL